MRVLELRNEGRVREEGVARCAYQKWASAVDPVESAESAASAASAAFTYLLHVSV